MVVSNEEGDHGIMVYLEDEVDAFIHAKDFDKLGPYDEY